MKNIPWKMNQKENELEEGEINIETEIDEISGGNKVGDVEIDERVKDKKELGIISGLRQWFH